MASCPITSWEIDGETVETVSVFIFLASKITADDDCSHEIKRRLLLGRKVMTNLDSILKSRDITLPTKVHLVKAMVFPVVMYGLRVGLWRRLSAKELMLLNCGVGSPCSPRDSQESSPTPQFKSINYLALSFIYSPTLNPYMTTGKTIALTRWTFVGKVMSLVFNMLSRSVIAFLPRSKHLLISWLQSLSAVILEPKKIKSVAVFIVSLSICHEVLGLGALILVFLNVEF